MHLSLAGSGSLAAMAVFEDKFRPNMEVRKAVQLVVFALGVSPVVCWPCKMSPKPAC